MSERRTLRRRGPTEPPLRMRVPLPVILGVALVAIAVVVGLVYLGERLRQPPVEVVGSLPASAAGPPAAGTPALAGPAPATLPAPGPIVYEGRSKGPREALVEIVEYADFQCPNCGAYARFAGRQVDEAYVARGLVRVSFRHFPFIGQESLWAALASECANEQGQFWAYHDKLFVNQSGENQGAFSREKLKGFARELRLDTARFDACLDNNTYRDLVREQFNEGERLGVRATPTFFIGEQKIEGAQPFRVLQRVTDDALAKRR